MTRPLLYVSNLVNQIDPDLSAQSPVEKKAQAGIDRLISMQTPSGGFGIWPGDTEPVMWGTAYVVHLLLDAKEQGYNVPEAALADAVRWLDANAESEPGGPKFRDTHPGYVQYVLARAGKPHAASAARLLEAQGPSSDLRAEEGRMLLYAALQASGDRRYQAELKKLPTSPVEDRRYNDWSYFSDLRRRGLTLTVYEELFGSDKTAGPLADLVASNLSGRETHHFTTQELMWGISGLARYVGPASEKVPTPRLLWGGKAVPLSKERSDNKTNFSWMTWGASGASDLSLEVPGSGDVRLALIATTEGVWAGPALPAGGEGLAVNRTWRSDDGAVLDADQVALGQMVYVALELKNTTSRRLENIALVDRIPAGWEIENPRLGRGALPDWVNADSVWSLDYLDLKDDRLNAFGALEPNQTVTVVYAVRAVTGGTFTAPEARAEAMYDPTLWARTGGEQVVITAPWEEELL